MNDYVYLFTVFIAMGAVTAAVGRCRWRLPAACLYGSFGFARFDQFGTRQRRPSCPRSCRRLPYFDCPMVC